MSRVRMICFLGLLWIVVLPPNSQALTNRISTTTTTPSPEAIGCMIRNTGGEEYIGQASIAASGRTCMPWTNAPDCAQDLADKNQTLSRNFCRNPLQPDRCHRERPWCYTSTSFWEYCDVPVCDDPFRTCMTALGMGSGAIADSQITASSYSDTFYPFYARINGNTSVGLYWIPRSSGYLQYIHVDLLNPHRITKLYIQGSDGYYTYVEAFKVVYSLDGLIWKAYSETPDGTPKEFSGNHGSDVAPVYLKTPFTAVHVVIGLMPGPSYMTPGLKLEIFGCLDVIPVPTPTEITQDSQLDQSWSAQFCPYVVRRALNMPVYATLTLGSSVKIVFVGESSGLNLFGCLEINAADGFEVQMLSNNPLSQLSSLDENGRPFWQGISINAACSSELNYVTVVGANTGVYFGVSSPSYAISHLETKLCRTGVATKSGISIKDITFRECTFDQNDVGVYVSTNGSLNVSLCVFKGNNYALKLIPTAQYFQSITIRITKSKFLQNYQAIVNDPYLFCYMSNLDISINENIFENHGGVAFDLSGYSCYAPTANIVIETCSFKNSRIALGLNAGAFNLSMTNSVISDVPQTWNTLTFRGRYQILLVTNTTFLNTSSVIVNTFPLESVTFENNKFLSSKGTTCIDVAIGTSTEQLTGEIFLTANEFLNNSVSYVIRVNDLLNINTTLTENILDNPQSSYELYVTTPLKVNYALNAERNYWGGSNRSHVTSRIYDFYDNFQSAIVDIQSIYTDSRRTDLTDTHTWMEWNSSNVFNGGKLTRNETLSANSANNSCINITASIYIPPNFKLEISGAMTICIPRYVGITVGGSLNLTGNDKPLIIRGSENAKWGGVAFINSNGSSMWHTHLLNLENGVSISGSSWNVFDSVLNISRGLFTTTLLPVTLSFYNTSIYCFDNTAINLESTNVTLQLRESAIRNQQYSSLNIRSSNLITMNARGTSFLSSIQLTSSSRLVANISHCQLKSGFSVNSYLANISATGNNFSASSDCLYLYLYANDIREINHLEIRQNYFRCGSRSLVVYDEQYSYGPTSVQFVQNVVDRGELFLQLYSPKSVGIAQNIFNGTDGLATNIYLRSSYYAVSPADSNDAVWISNNAFKDRVGLVNSAVLSLSCLNYRSSIRLSDNTFANNSVNYVISSNCPGLYVTRNAFLNPKANYDYRTLVPYTSTNDLILYAIGNFWNLSSYADISARILDQLDDSTLPSVELSPWFNDINRTVLGNFEAGFFRGSDYEIGGRLTENITLRNQGRPYMVEDDIIIPTEKTLFIEDGVQLIFKQGGITISGRLVALGNENSWITMQPSDNSSFWKGITMQQPLFDEVRHHKDDWWEILYKGEWKTIEYYSNSDNMKNVAEVLCKQAGYDGSRDVSEYDCSTATTPNSVTDSNSNATTPNPKQSSTNPPCNDPTWRLSVICQEETFSINDCSIYGGYLYRKLAKISCLPPAVDKSTTTYRILSQLGGYLTYLSDNSLGVVDHELDEIFHVFIVKTPCLASGQSADCVSLMPLGKPGWFVRHIGAENIILEPETNPSDSTTFDQDASFFIRQDAFLSGYISFESFNAPGSFIALQTQNDSQQRLALTSVNGTDQDYNNGALSFRLIAFSKRKKRAVVTDYNSNSGFQSILRYVRISSANVGISIKGRAPTLESVIVERSKGNGIVYTGYASGNISIANTTVSLSGGLGIRLEPSINTFLCNIYIRSCNFTGNADCGISFNGAVNVTVSNSIFTNNVRGIWIEMNNNNFGVNNTAIVRYSEFFSNQSYPSVYCYGNQLICHIHNNVLQHQRRANSEGSYVMQITYCYAVISNNLFENSSYISYIFWTNAKTLEFRGNILRNNLARRVMVLENSNSIMNITGNDFIDNNFYYDSYTIYFRVSTNTLFTGNVLSNNVNYELYFEEMIQDDGRIFDISLNIWNKDSYSDVIKSIYCFYNDMNRILVNIWPFIKDSKNMTLVPTPTDQDYFFENGIGGDVISTITVPSQNESYAVERSIFVKQGTTLIVEEGTVLKFREGRGLFVKGNLILEGTAESPITFTSAYPIPSSANYWNGVVISLPSSSNLSAIAANVSHVIIEYNQNGALVVAPIIEISGFILRNTGAGLNVRGSNISVINSTFSTTYYALTIERWSQFQASESYAIVQGSVFNSSTRGVYSNLDFAAVRIVDSTFLGCDYGLSFTGTRSGDTNLIVENSTFVSNNLAIWMELYSGSNFTLSGSTIYGYFRSSYYDAGASGLYIYNLDWGSILIQNNYFTNLSYSAVNIRTSTYSRPLGTITIGGNTFSRISKTALQIYSPLYSVTAIQNNTFTWNNFQTDSSAVAIQIYPVYTADENYPGNLNFTRNLMQENGGKYIASFICTTAIQPSTEARFPYFNVLSNVFRDNSPTDSLIYTEYNQLNINHNIFSVQPTGYILRVGYSKNLSENCTFNWWATTDRDIVAQRIYDGHVDSTIGIVQYEPFLDKSEYSCDTVSGCSGHGICVFPEVCQCDLGWDESDCSQPSCAQVYNCLGRGECVGPNTCRCNEGYVNADCSGATCYERNNCSSRGLCVDQNVCLCAELFGGDDCSRCNQYRWGPTCSLCPNCVHGSCDQTSGACVCDGSNWAGALCNTCAPKFYGSACLPIVNIDRLIPQSGPDVGNTSVHFRGANFPNATTYRCRFDSDVVAGLWLSDEDVLCLSPAHPAGQATVDLSISEERGFLTPQFKYTYYPYCPASTCGNQLNPPRGYCSMGSCICYLPWFDQNCGSLGLAPKIVPVLSQTILESQPFEITLNTSQGSEPFIWSLLDAPLGMSIKATSGVLSWTKAVAGPTPYNVTVSCRNVIDIDQATFTLRVPLSYSAVLDALSKGPFLTSQPVRIRGTVRWIVNNTFLVGQQIPVNILIRTATSTRTISAITAYGIVVFYSTFYPASYETGLFEADARHPLDHGFTAQQSWSVYGLSLQVNPTSFQGLTGNYTFPSFLTISNTGVDTLTFLQLTKVDLPIAMRFVNSKISCEIVASNCPLSNVLRPSENIILNASVQGVLAGRLNFAMTLSTGQGLTLQASVSFNFQQQTPVLSLTPGLIDATVTRGSVYYFQVNVSNSGLRPATNVSVRLPPNDMLSVISFGTNNNGAGRPLILEVGDIAVLILQVRPPVQQALGEITGNILVASVETGATLSFRLVVSSLSRVNLTVSVEDEYTYFAVDQPLVANATVILVPRFAGDTLTLITNTSGKVTFLNISESYYTLYTSCERHAPDSRVIFVTGGSGSYVAVFLHRIAVTYNWVVTQISFEDRYDIKLEATFETHVPIPVVTVTPNKLDLDVLELGLMPFINFEITNHGLIAAQGYRFQLPSPDAHPFITFTMDRELIGDIAANTTVQVVVSVTIDTAKQQLYYSDDVTSADVIIDLRCLQLVFGTLYFYVCDDKRYQTDFIPLFRDISLFNCGGGGGAGGGGFDDYQWSPSDLSPFVDGSPFVYYVDVSVTTPIDCDRLIKCLKTAWYCIWSYLELAKGFAIVKNVQSLQKGELLTDFVKCLKTAVTSVRNIASWVWSFATDPEGVAKLVLLETLDVVLGCSIGPFSDIKQCVCNAYQCFIENIGCDCDDYKCLIGNLRDRLGLRKKRDAGQTTDNLLPEYTRRYLSVLQYSRLGELILVDRRWFGANANDWWRSAVYPTLQEGSDGGQYISVNEFNQAMSYSLPSNITSDMAATLLMRINDSFVSWDGGVTSNSNGTISLDAFNDIAEVIYNDTLMANQAGFNSVIEWFLDAADAMNEADTDTEEGVCAKVRIQILQKLVLTRSAFSARLELENGETEQLTNIAVELIISDHSTQSRANDMFSIGRPEITGMSDVDGNGVLNIQVKGSAQWLIAAYNTAAPTEDTQYDIGGTLYYTVNGENITVPLFPDTVTVKPDPRLYVYYFLEKYINSDDPLTTDVVEPVVPFSLGILITNNGYGAASNLEITSAQPEIIDNEKGLLITIAIIGTQLGNSNVSPSLTINFGDILPQTTKLARWIMTSTLAGVFSNYSATFTNVNPLGDPQLSVLDSLKIFELMHVIRVDFPTDDGLVDFLTISTSKLNVVPDQIYLSDNGTSPLNVSVGNVTSLTTISSSQRQVLLQLYVVCSCTGWVYFRVEYPPSELSLSEVFRSDGRPIRVGDNIWVGKIEKANFLHLVDYIPASETQYRYNIQLSKINAQAAQFVEDVYYVNITEEEDPTYLLEVSVDSRNDDLTVTYSITDTALPFSIDASNGTLRTTAKLDRETQDRYSLVVIAVDNGSPPLTSTAIVAVSVVDINDNPPVFGFVPTDIYIEDITPLGYVLLQITVTDKDIGLNGIVTLSLVDLSGLFSLDATNNSLLTKEALNQKTGTYSLFIKAQDEGVPNRTSEIKVIVHVVDKDLHQPQFSTPHYIFSVNETKNAYEFIGRLIATDADNPNENLTYSISQRFQSSGSCTLPFQVDSVSGVITNILELRSDSCSNYIFEVQVTDSGAPPTGPLSGRANVTVYVQDINDNAPEFPQSSYSVHIPENVYSETTLLTINATDKDFGQNGAIADYMLSQIYPQSSNITKFKLTVDAGAAVIKAVQPLDRELQDRYLLQLVAVDGGQPPLSSNATTIEVIVDDVNDNSPIFINTTATVTIPRNIPVNTILYTVSATDADTGNNAIVRYLLVNSSQYINVQPDSGNVILVGSLQGTDITSIDLSIRATDGQLSSNATFQLRVFISDRNIYAPRFDSHEYRINVNESTPSGSSILRLTATDQDSPILYYFIIDGNDGNRFRVDSSTGVLRVVGEVNNRLVRFYNLTVRVNDSDTGGPDTLFDMANVYITITRPNRYSPVFSPGPTIQIHITEGTTSPNMTQLTATDQDGDNITYSLVNATGSQSFDVDPYSGWLSVIVPLHREPSSTQRMIQVTATDNGVPPRQSTVDIIVVVDPANVESTAMSPINSSQGVTSQFYPATFETTSIHGSLAPTILSSAVSKSSLQNVTTTAGNGQRTATNLGGQQTITAEDGQRTTTWLGGQQTIATGDGQRTTTQLGGQQTIATGDGQRTTTQLGGQQAITAVDGQRTTTHLDGQQTITTGNGQKTTTRQTVTTPDGQSTATIPGGQETISGVAVIVIVVVGVVVLTVVVVVASCTFFHF